MRSRRRTSLEPIHIRELLSGAGRRGFLSVLDPPVPAPHLRELGRDGDSYDPGAARAEPLTRLSALAEALLGRLARQEQALRTISEVAYRINGGAVTLQRQTDAVCSRHRERLSSQERRKAE